MSTKELATEIVETMTRLGLYLCFAESCTAGGVPKVITSVPGASKMFLGGITAYAPKAMASVLDISAEKLEEIGLVSMKTTNRLSEIGLQRMGGDICIATTGYLGPFNKTDYPTDHEAFIYVSDRFGGYGEQLHLDGKREANRQAMLRAAFPMVLKRLQIKDWIK